MFKMTVDQKKLEYKLYLARENPEPTFDISECGITNIPQGSYALCKVLRKKVLNLKKNYIKELNSNGNLIEDLIVITDIYAEYNKIEKLPDNINSIQYLQILDLSHNQLKSLPSSLGSLLYLRKIFLQYNNLKDIPTSILSNKSALEIFDISENKEFSIIPVGILNLQKLKRFSYTYKYLEYPSQVVCQKGISEIMRVLCKDAGVQFTNDILQRFSDDIDFDDVDLQLIDSTVLDYESFKNNRIRFLQSIESELRDANSYHDCYITKAIEDRKILIDKIAEEEIRITKDIALLHLQRDLRKEQLINDVKAVEADAKSLIEEIIAVNKLCFEHGRIQDELDKDTVKQYQVYQEEYNRLRKEEILHVMTQMLVTQDSTDRMLQNQFLSKEDLKDKITRSKSLTDDSISEILKDRQNKRNNLFSEIERQEIKQKSAFQNLQLKKDVRTLRIKQQIASVESSLMRLSQVEQIKRNEKTNMELNILNERRTDLVKILELLMEEKYQREQDLMNRLIEIEHQRKDNQVDFWLVQYQRLLDMKPPNFNDESSTFDILVLDVMNRSNCKEYLPFLQRKNIGWEQLKRFQEKDLLNIGIHSSSKIKDILCAISQITDEQFKKSGEFKMKNSPKSQESQPALITTDYAPATMTSHKESECCICLVEETTMLFLECGHICCCEKCSNNLVLCPLCRQTISRFIKLMGV